MSGALADGSAPLSLYGRQVSFNQRTNYKEQRWRRGLMTSRPYSAVSDPNAYEGSQGPAAPAPLTNRPFSADTVLCAAHQLQQAHSFCETCPVKDPKGNESRDEPTVLPSAQILQSLLSETVDACTYKEEEQEEEEQGPCGGQLLPGVKTKPPLPSRATRPPPKGDELADTHVFAFMSNGNEVTADGISRPHTADHCYVEDLEEPPHAEILHPSPSSSSSSCERDAAPEWLLRREQQTDEELRHVHESIYDVEHGERAPKAKVVAGRRPPAKEAVSLRDVYTLCKPKSARAVRQDEPAAKKQPKGILKGGVQRKWTKKEAPSGPDPAPAPDVTSWMSANESHDNFLDFLNKLDEQLEAAPEAGGGALPHNDNFDEITSILEVLEKEDLKSQRNIETIKELVNSELSLDTRSGSTCSLTSTASNYNEFLSYLDDIDQSCMKSLKSAKERLVTVTKVNSCAISVEQIPRLEDLLSYTQVELAHYVADLTLRLRERSSAVGTLQAELAKLRAALTTKADELERIFKANLDAQKDDYEAIVKRHQKFIDQLIADKKSLNKQCEGLINEMKLLEDRYNTNVRAMEQRHKVDMQKAKDMHAAGEKLRREKWIEGKTQKIKEMAVKSLEPELQSIEARHQNELGDVRALHKRELEELELRAARKTQQQCEALRQQLTAEREAAISHERDVLRQRVEKLVEAEERGYQEQRRRLQAEHSAKMVECEERVAAAQAERDRAVEAARTLADEQLQAAQRRHAAELRNVRDALELEFEAWKNNFRKQQSIKLAESEAQMKVACKKDRDREIELVIDRLERESHETRQQIEQANENRLRRLKDKYEEEMTDLEKALADYKSKYSETKEKLLADDESILNLRTNVKHLQTQLQQSREIIDSLSQDKDKIRNQIKSEFQEEIHLLENEVRNLKNSKDDELQKIFTKVKLTVAHKDELLTQLSSNNTNLQEKCTLLENLLQEKQREYLIK